MKNNKKEIEVLNDSCLESSVSAECEPVMTVQEYRDRLQRALSAEKDYIQWFTDEEAESIVNSRSDENIARLMRMTSPEDYAEMLMM